MKKKIVIFTAARSDFGIMKKLSLNLIMIKTSTLTY